MAQVMRAGDAPGVDARAAVSRLGRPGTTLPAVTLFTAAAADASR